MRYLQSSAASRRRAAGAAEEDEELVTVPLAELESRAREANVYDCRPFLQGRLFKNNYYTFDEQTRTITKRFGGKRREEL
jgi:DNA replication licensing factor MCM2